MDTAATEPSPASTSALVDAKLIGALSVCRPTHANSSCTSALKVGESVPPLCGSFARALAHGFHFKALYGRRWLRCHATIVHHLRSYLEPVWLC